ncbi:hypothetical protein, partial [Streptomyces sp. NRRL F-4489]|uniref:hypothetical protein n=1 Tax=Streptomyces sp. NRRL F-4489 TaxID=1609095 RepID=UPI001F17A846
GGRSAAGGGAVRAAGAGAGAGPRWRRLLLRRSMVYRVHGRRFRAVVTVRGRQNGPAHEAVRAGCAGAPR